MPRLVTPSLERVADFIAMLDRSQQLGEGDDGFRLVNPDPFRFKPQGLLDVLARQRSAEVRQSVYWLIDDGEALAGEARVRHTLTPALEVEGGHVGYFVHPDHRGRGLGHIILKFALAELARTGLARALVTCNADNTASRRVITRAGGVFRRETTSPVTGRRVLTFWVATAPPPPVVPPPGRSRAS